MTKEEFKSLQDAHKESGKSIKNFLKDKGVHYSTYNYWRKKFEAEEQALPLAPIKLRSGGASTSDAYANTKEPYNAPELSAGVMVAFPNGVRAHFGRGSEDLLMQVINQSLASHVLPQ